MLINTSRESNNKQSTKIVIVGILILIIIYWGTSYYQKSTRENVKNSSFTGIITQCRDAGGRSGNYYYTDKRDCIIASYFFNERHAMNLNIGDSIYKAPDSFRLYIYKKDNQGKYVFDRLAQIHDDSY